MKSILTLVPRPLPCAVVILLVVVLSADNPQDDKDEDEQETDSNIGDHAGFVLTGHSDLFTSVGFLPSRMANCSCISTALS